MNSEQKKYLKDYLSAIERAHRDGGPKPPPEPSHIKLARKVVRAWDAKHNRYDFGRGRRTRIEKAAGKVREVIMFGDAPKALKAVKAFERRVFK